MPGTKKKIGPKLPSITCKRCGGTWYPIKLIPDECACCNSYDYDTYPWENKGKRDKIQGVAFLERIRDGLFLNRQNKKEAINMKSVQDKKERTDREMRFCRTCGEVTTNYRCPEDSRKLSYTSVEVDHCAKCPKR